MKVREVRKLYKGDEVYWNDPDEGRCSRIYKIHTIHVWANMVVITEPDGSTLECFADELS